MQFNRSVRSFTAVFAMLCMSLTTACTSQPDSQFVSLIKNTPGNANMAKDLINSAVLGECNTNVGAKAYFGWLELKPVEITLDKNDQFTGKPMAPYKLYFIVLDKKPTPEEIHRGDEYISALAETWDRIGCGNLPSINDGH